MSEDIPKDAYMDQINRDSVEAMATRDASVLRPGDLRANSALEIIQKRQEEKVYTIEGTQYSRNQVMELLVVSMTQARNPMSKVDFCRVSGAPTLREIAAWERAYPSFKEEMMAAEKICAELLAWRSVEISLAEDDPKAGTLTKAKAESLRWMASKLDTHRFADRKIEQHEDIMDKASTQELMDLVKNAVIANHELLKELTHAERQQLREIGFVDAEIVEPTAEVGVATHGEIGGCAVHPDQAEG